MRMMASLLSVVMLLAVVTLTGCKTSEVGVKNNLGNVSGYVDALPPQVIAAAEQVAADMELIVEDAASTQIDGKLVAKTAKGKKIKIDVDRYGDNVSSLSIKVGTFGKESLSLEVYNAIRAKLANRARSASPPSSLDANLLN